MAYLAGLAGLVRRRLKISIIAATLTVLVAVGSLVTADLWWRRDHVLRIADTRAANLTLVLDEYVRGSFSSADAALRQLAIHGRRVGGPRQPGEVWNPILAAAKTALPDGSGSISVTDRDGIITHSTLRAIVGQPRKNSYIYQRLSGGGLDQLIVDRPLLAVTAPRQYIIPVGRPLTTGDGQFDGVVVATVTPESFRAFFRTLDIGQAGVITVLHPDGVVLFHEPSARNPINDAATDDPLLTRARQQPVGIVHEPLTAGGPRFITSYRMIGEPSMVVAVSLSEDEVLEDWRGQRRVSAIAFAALALTLAAMMLALFRVVSARARAEQELQALQRQEAARLRDANERLAAALEREQRARQETEAASYLKDEFLMTVSHELRTPLTAIYGWARVLGTKELERPQQARAIAAIERNAHAQTRLIDDLLDVSRAISGKLRLDARVIDVAVVLADAIETVSPAMTARQIAFEAVCDPTTPPILADPDRLQQIAWNLLSNAIKFTPEGGSVRVGLSHTASAVEIEVSDTGSGIAADFLPHVFERFRQGDVGSRRRYGGLGLGLAIVRHLTELHGGTVSADSPGEGQGSTFRVILPVRPVGADEAAGPAQPIPIRADQDPPRLEGVRVLVVDHQPDARELLESILGTAGAAVVTAGSAAEAVRLLDQRPADAVIVDQDMPEPDRFRVLEAARAAGAGRPLVAIAITGYARSEERRRALDAGFDWYFAKPVEPVELVAVVATLGRASDSTV